MSEIEYLDPYEGEGPISTTPPPPCDQGKKHEVCVPPAWGEKIPGDIVLCRCLLCHQENRHHAIRCLQCMNAPGCCACIWGYMRSQYNSGCPLCRAGDPQGEDPLAPDQRRITPMRRGQVTRVVRRSRRGRGRRGVGEAVLLCGVGRARGRARLSLPEEPREEEPQEQNTIVTANTARRSSRRVAIRRPGRGRATTIESVEEDKKEEEEGER